MAPFAPPALHLQPEDTLFWKDEVSGISRSPPRGSVRLVTFQTGCLELVSHGQCMAS